MNIRRRILVPMIALTIGSCVTVLTFSMILFNRELSNAKYNIIDVAAMVVENEIDELKIKAQIAAFGMAKNPDLIEALLNNDHEKIASVAIALKSITSLDYCVIIDSNGYVLTRTHEPQNHGDNAAHLPHVRSALDGVSEAHIMPGPTVRLGASAGAPIYDSNMNMIGVVSLGFRLDSQDFVYRLKEITGCEITTFLHNERISTTLFDEEGVYAIGTMASDGISDKVLMGEPHVGITQLFGSNVLSKYIPLYGANDEIVGMMFVGYDTTENDKKIIFFMAIGILLTIMVLAVCVVIAMFISRVVERQLNKAQDKIAEEMEKAKKLTHWYESILDTTPLPISVTDADMNWTFVNKAAEEFVGTRLENMLGKPCNNWGTHICNTTECGIACAKRGLNKTFFTREDKSYQVDVGILKGLDNETIGFIEIVQDVTHISEREKELAHTHALIELQLTKLNLMVKAAKIGLWDMEIVKDDPVNPANIFMWSDDFRHMLGYTDEEDFPNILRSWSDLLHPDDKERIFDAFTRHLLDVTGKTPYDVEYQLLKKNGEYSYYRASGETIRDKDGKAIRTAGALIDITEAKVYLAEIEKAQESLRQARDTAETANRSKSIFLANMSHEIRTPMNSIIGFSELAQDDDISPKTKQYLANISDNAKWLLNIINDILDSTKIESGKIVLEHIPFDLHDVITQCQSAILPKTLEKGITLYCYVEPFTGKKLLGDPVRLRQAIMNLLSNAVKFTNNGKVKLLTSVIASNDKYATINFEIKDSGIGMSTEQIANIFEPFMQADNSITRRFGGTGLGLAITKSIIEMMGGTLEVESELHVGSRFSFTLTFTLIDDTVDIPSQKIMFNDIEKPNFIGEVLICEDNGLNQQVISEHLVRVGLKSVVAHDGKEGVDVVTRRMRSSEKPFDLILMDIHMPVMDGLEAATKITELGIKTPILALTANIMSNDLELYKTNGMIDYLGKPFTSQELWKCLIKYLPAVNFTAVDKNRQLSEEDKSLKQLRVYFAKNNKTTFTKIMQALDDGNIKLAHRLSHTLKSNAGQIGEKRLQEVAAEVEAILSDGENRLNEEQTNVLGTELKSVLERLECLLLDSDTKNSIETNVEEMKKIIERLEPMLIKSNPECMKLLDEIRTIPGAEGLAHHVEEFEFKSALDELNKLKERLEQNNE